MEETEGQRNVEIIFPSFGYQKERGGEIEGNELEGQSLLHFVLNISFQHWKDLKRKLDNLPFLFLPFLSLSS